MGRRARRRRGRVRDRCAEIQVRRDLAEREVEVRDRDAAGLSRGEGDRDVHRDRRGADATTRAEDGDRPARPPGRGPCRPTPERGRPRRAEKECLDPRVELPGIDRVGHDLVRPSLDERDAGIDLA
jgi:hypothetical protein